jgi:hypothetical protein
MDAAPICRCLATVLLLMALPAARIGAADAQPAPASGDELMAPGPEHAALMALAGDYDVTGKFWMMPHSAPAESTAKATFTPILGGRYLRQDYHGSMMGVAYDGIGIEGFDRGRGRYTSVWVDSISTGQLALEGASGDGGATRTYIGMMDDAEHPGKTVAVRWVCTRIDANAFRFALYEGAGAQAWQCMDLVYRRAVSTGAAAQAGSR